MSNNKMRLGSQIRSPAGSVGTGRSSRIDRHSLEVSATVLRDILLGKEQAGVSDVRLSGHNDFAEIGHYDSRQFEPTLKPFYGPCLNGNERGPISLGPSHSPFRPSHVTNRLVQINSNNNGSLHFSNLDLRLVGRPQSHSPASKIIHRQVGGMNHTISSRLVLSAQNSPIRGYPNSDGSIGSRKSPRPSLDSSDSGASLDSPVSTSSPLPVRRTVKRSDLELKRPPYYVADTVNNVSGSSSTHSWFNVVGPSSSDPSASSEDIPYMCAKPCLKTSFDDNCDGAAYDDSMYRLLPVPQSYILPKMGHEFSHDSQLFQRRIEHEGHVSFFTPQGHDFYPCSSCATCVQFSSPPICYDNVGPHGQMGLPQTYYDHHFQTGPGNTCNNNNNIHYNGNSNTDNHRGHLDICSSQAHTSRFATHLQSDARALPLSVPLPMALPCCMSCCFCHESADGFVCEGEGEGAGVGVGAGATPPKPRQSGFENGGDKIHCCSSQVPSFQHLCEPPSTSNCVEHCVAVAVGAGVGARIEPKPCPDKGRPLNYPCCDKHVDVDNFDMHFKLNNDITSQNATPHDPRYRWQGGSGVPGLDASIHQIKKDDERDSARWSAQSLHSLTSLKIDLPRVQNSNLNSSAPGPIAGLKNFSTPEKLLRAQNLPRVSSGRKPLVLTKSQATSNPKDHNSPAQSGDGTQHILSDSFRRRRALQDSQRRKTVAHFGPRSLPAVGHQDTSEIPRAPIITPDKRAESISQRCLNDPPPLPVKDGLNLIQPTSLSLEGTRSCEDHQTAFQPRNHPHRHSISFLHPAAFAGRPEEGVVSSDVSFLVDESGERSFDKAHLGDDYRSSKEREGDYSYAYDCSVSPAFIIKWNGEMEQSYDGDEDNAKEENIYEEIDKRNDNEDEDGNSFVDKEQSDGNSSRKSLSLNSDSGIGDSCQTASQQSYRRVVTKLGTLDVAQRGPNKKRVHNQHNPKSVLPGSIPSAGNGQPLHQSSLDELLSRTTPGMTPHQRLNLRKSLVDELFEELIQRHHSKVLGQLRLDVEEFIAPSPSPVPQKIDEENVIDETSGSATPHSSPFQRTKSKLFPTKSCTRLGSATASSSTSSSPLRLRKCELMDLKEVESDGHDNSKADDSKMRRKSASQLFSSARKYSEVLQKKYFSRNTSAKAKSQQPQPPSQVSRKGRRPLSAFIVGTSYSTTAADSVSDNMSDSEEDSARRLQRSKIIASFLRDQDSQEKNQNESANF